MGHNCTGEAGTVPPRLIPGRRNRREPQVFLVLHEAGQVEENFRVRHQRVSHAQGFARTCFRRSVQQGISKLSISSVFLRILLVNKTSKHNITEGGIYIGSGMSRVQINFAAWHVDNNGVLFRRVWRPHTCSQTSCRRLCANNGETRDV